MMQVLIRTMIKQRYYKSSLHKLSSASPGLTLIELVLGVTLLVLFLGGVITFHLFGLRSFAAGEMQTSAHQALRRTADRIADELRYAIEDESENVNITLYDDSHVIGSQSGNYIFIGDDNDRCRSGECIILQGGYGSDTRILFDPASVYRNLDHLDLSLEFIPTEQSVIEFHIRIENITTASRTEKGDYEIKTSVYLNNFDGMVPTEGCGDNNTPCTVIRYASPEPPDN